MQAQSSDNIYAKDNEIDLAELWRVIFAKKIVILLTCIVFSLASVWYALSLPNIYKASVLLTSANSQNLNGNSLLSGQLGTLASFAGVNLPGNMNDNTTLALEILQSRAFIESFIERHQLMVPLLAANGWDQKTNQIIYNEDVYDVANKRWLNPDEKPTLWAAYVNFLENLNIIQNKSSGTYTVELSYYSPELAKLWLSLLIKDLNELMREADKKETLASIEFLSEKLNSTQLSSMKNVFYQLVEEQTKRLMLVEIKKEYTLKTVDPSQVPERKDKPKRSLIVILGAMLGGIFAVLMVLISFNRNKT